MRRQNMKIHSKKEDQNMKDLNIFFILIVIRLSTTMSTSHKARNTGSFVLSIKWTKMLKILPIFFRKNDFKLYLLSMTVFKKYVHV